MKLVHGKKIRVALAGGGTGGHVYPLLAVAAAITEQTQAAGLACELHYFGANDRFRKDIEGQGIRCHSILTGKLRRYASILTLIDGPKVVIGLIQSLFKLYVLMPDVLFSKGGPGGFPVVFAAWFYKIPVIIHESDSVPSLTTMLCAKFSKKIGLTFESTAKYFDPRKTLVAGNPVRPSLLSARLPQEEAKRKLGFDPAKPLLYVTGGSQGAMKLNEFVILNLGSILPLVQVLHQTGPANFMEAKKLAEAELVQLPPAMSTQSRYLPMAYLSEEESKDALTAADVVLARAGSGSIAEAAAFGKPLILVPLANAARDHQRENAQAVFEGGAAIVIEEANLNGNIFTSELQQILTNPAAYQALAAASAALSRPDAARTLAATVLELA